MYRREMGNHARQVFPRVPPCYRCCNAAVIYLFFYLSLHAYISVVRISALRFDGNSGLPLADSNVAPSPAPESTGGADSIASTKESGGKSCRVVTMIIIIASAALGSILIVLSFFYFYFKKKNSFGSTAPVKPDPDGKPSKGNSKHYQNIPKAPDGFGKPERELIETPKPSTTSTIDLFPKKTLTSGAIKTPPAIEQSPVSGSVSVNLGPLISSTDTVSLRRSDLRKATRNFTSKIGEGGFGPVYFGKLPGTQIEVAVKVQAKESKQGAREFATEVEILSRAKHPNLVSLIGYSSEKKAYTLVYEFLSGGTLQDRLYGDRAKPALDWRARLNIAVQAAKGLDFLHNDCSPSIIHRDIKTANILLTKSGDAKVTDFGLSKFMEEDAAEISKCSVKGTSGYLDPEYYDSQKLSHKSDVYSFGIVLLELVAGREALDTDLPREEWKIGDWTRTHLIRGDLDKVVDKALEGKFSRNSMWMVAELAMTCVEPRSVHRPSMNQVVLELESALREEAEANPL